MKKALVVLFLQLCCWGVFGQEKADVKETIQYVEVPREQVLVVLVYQPGCPLRIEDSAFLFRTNNPRTVIRYKVRNVSSKPIASFTVSSWSTKGGEGTLPVLMTGSDHLLYPGRVVDSLEEGVQIVPLTEELRRKLKGHTSGLFEGKMREVKFLLVDQVRFADGSSYKDQRVSEALSDYLFEHIGGSDP